MNLKNFLYIFLAIVSFSATACADEIKTSPNMDKKVAPIAKTNDSKEPKDDEHLSKNVETSSPAQAGIPITVRHDFQDALAVNLKSEQDLLPLLSSYVTLAIVVSGTLITLWQINKSTQVQRETVKLQREISRSETLARAQQTWIESLRTELSEFVTVCGELETLFLGYKYKWKAEPFSENPWPGEHSTLLYKAEELYTKVLLRLNPDEFEHRELLNAMKKIKTTEAKEPWLTRYELFISSSQIVLKNAWQQVKQPR